MAEITLRLVIDVLNRASPALDSLNRDLGKLLGDFDSRQSGNEAGSPFLGVIADLALNRIGAVSENPEVGHFDRYMLALGDNFERLTDPLFSHLADEQEYANKVQEAMDVFGASFDNAGLAEPPRIKMPSGESISQEELLERTAEKTRALAFAQQEAEEMGIAFAISQQDAAEATANFAAEIGAANDQSLRWNEINQDLLGTMSSQLDLIHLQAIGYGGLQEQWDGLLLQYDAGTLSLQALEEAQLNIATAAVLAQASLEEMSSNEVRAALKDLGVEAKTIESAVRFLEGGHEFSLSGVINIVNKGISVGDALALSQLSKGQRDAILPELQASGGPLADLALVGEEGPELIIDGIVIPAQETRKLMALGLLPKRRFAFGGPLIGGRSAIPAAPPDFDPLNLDQRALLRSSRRRASASVASSAAPSSASRASRSPRRERQTTADVALAIEAAVSSSVAAAIPDAAIAASQAAAAVAPSTLNSATQQLTRDMGRDIARSNERLMGRVDQLILETRRMKIYFRDAVRLLAD